jgi:hypothetical protein
MAIIKINADNTVQHEIILWLRENTPAFSVFSTTSYRTVGASYSADAYFTINEENVALEFLLRYDGVAVPEQQFNQIIAVHKAGSIISR